ncbi:hypothetical protein K9M47_01875 [Candidatus Gracilibacteria bacterium]|nr:hypothetical protein [Candidatus Gracilibacteria bacterium]
MQTIKCWWAGRLIPMLDIDNDLSIEEKLEEIQKRLKQKQMRLSACGTEFLITELCVDIMQDEKLVAMRNLKG